MITTLIAEIKKYEMWILRASIAFPMVWAGVGGLKNPYSWIGYVPDFAEIFMSREAFLIFHSYLMLVLAVLVMTGPYRWFFAAISTLNLLAILVIFGVDDVTFRDVSILLVAVLLTAREVEQCHLSSDG